jgi:hypothetical protein
MRERKNAPPAILLANQLTNHLLREALSMQVFTVLGKPVDFNVPARRAGKGAATLSRKSMAERAMK